MERFKIQPSEELNKYTLFDTQTEIITNLYMIHENDLTQLNSFVKPQNLHRVPILQDEKEIFLFVVEDYSQRIMEISKDKQADYFSELKEFLFETFFTHEGVTKYLENMQQFISSIVNERPSQSVEAKLLVDMFIGVEDLKSKFSGLSNDHL